MQDKGGLGSNAGAILLARRPELAHAKRIGDWGQVGSGNVTELRGRAQQGRNTGSRTLANQTGEALDRLGAMISENIRGNRQREGAARTERQRVNNERGPARESQYVRNDQRARDAGILNESAQRTDVARTNDTAAFMRRNRGMPVTQRAPSRGAHLRRNDLQEAITMSTEANVSDARARDASVTETQPVAPGAELTRGQGPGRRGVLQRPFTVRVEGQDVAVSDNQRTVLSEYVRQHPRAFPTFADWFNAISTIDGNTPDNLSVEDVVMARRQWDNPEQGGADPRSSRFAPPNAEFTLDPNYVRTRGDVTYGADYSYQNIDQGIDPETGQRRIVGQRTSPVRGPQGPRPDAPVEARRPITPEERLTAESELMRIVSRNRSERDRGRSRTMQRAANDDPNTLQPILNLPRQIADAVIARARLAGDVQDLRRRQEANTSDIQKGDGGAKGDSKQMQHGTLMTAQDVVDEQVSRQRTAEAVNGIDLGNGQQQVDPFSREPILPIRPPAEGETGGSRTLQRLRNAGRTTVGGVELQPTENGVRGRVRF